MSAQIHRVILDGRDILGHLVKPSSEQGQLDQVAQGCDGISVSPRAGPPGACYRVWPPPGWKIFFFISNKHLPFHFNNLCLLPPDLCIVCTSGTKSCSVVCNLSISSLAQLYDFTFTFSSRITKKLFEPLLEHHIFQIPDHLSVSPPNSSQHVNVLHWGAQSGTQCLDVESQVSNTETPPLS